MERFGNITGAAWNDRRTRPETRRNNTRTCTPYRAAPASPIFPRMRPAHLPAAASEPFETRERCVITELLNSPEAPEASLAEARVAPGVITERHVLSVHETYVITKGRGRMELGETRFDVAAGDAVTIPAGTPQRIENTGEAPLVFLCLCTPRFTPESYRPLEGDAP